MNGKLTFKKSSGRIKFLYTEPINSRRHYQIDGKIPKKVVKQGKVTIRAYATKEINQARKEWKKADEIEESIRRNHIPIQTSYKDGTPLEGRIVEATSKIIRVELDNPCNGKGSINFGFASVMAGHYIFTKSHEMSRQGYNATYRALCSAYEDSLHKQIKDLVRQLNKHINLF